MEGAFQSPPRYSYYQQPHTQQWRPQPSYELQSNYVPSYYASENVPTHDSSSYVENLNGYPLSVANNENLVQYDSGNYATTESDQYASVSKKQSALAFSLDGTPYESGESYFEVIPSTGPGSIFLDPINAFNSNSPEHVIPYMTVDTSEQVVQNVVYGYPQSNASTIPGQTYSSPSNLPITGDDVHHSQQSQPHVKYENGYPQDSQPVQQYSQPDISRCASENMLSLTDVQNVQGIAVPSTNDIPIVTNGSKKTTDSRGFAETVNGYTDITQQPEKLMDNVWTIIDQDFSRVFEMKQPVRDGADMTTVQHNGQNNTPVANSFLETAGALQAYMGATGRVTNNITLNALSTIGAQPRNAIFDEPVTNTITQMSDEQFRNENAAPLKNIDSKLLSTDSGKDVQNGIIAVDPENALQQEVFVEKEFTQNQGSLPSENLDNVSLKSSHSSTSLRKSTTSQFGQLSSITEGEQLKIEHTSEEKHRLGKLYDSDNVNENQLALNNAAEEMFSTDGHISLMDGPSLKGPSDVNATVHDTMVCYRIVEADGHVSTISHFNPENVPEEAVDDVISKFFKLGYAAVAHSVSKEEVLNSNLPLMEDVLKLSVCAFGCRYSTHPFFSRYTGIEFIAGDPFYFRARTLLKDAIKNPTMSVLASLMVLALYASSTGRGAASSSLTILVYLLARTLNLHIDPALKEAEKLNGGKPFSIMEREKRRRVFWTVLGIELLIAPGAGRFHIVKPNSFRVLHPHITFVDGGNVMKRLEAEGREDTYSSEVIERLENKQPIIPETPFNVVNSSLLLLQIFGEVQTYGRIMTQYVFGKNLNTESVWAYFLDSEKRFAHCDSMLRSWYRNVHPILRNPGRQFTTEWNGEGIPNPPHWCIAFLVILYHTTVSILRRYRVVLRLQELSGKTNFTSVESTPDFREVLRNDMAYLECNQSSVSVSILLEVMMDSNPYLTDMSPHICYCIFQTALHHLFSIDLHRGHPEDKQAAIRRVKTHIKALRRLSKFYMQGTILSALLYDMCMEFSLFDSDESSTLEASKMPTAGLNSNAIRLPSPMGISKDRNTEISNMYGVNSTESPAERMGPIGAVSHSASIGSSIKDRHANEGDDNEAYCDDIDDDIDKKYLMKRVKVSQDMEASQANSRLYRESYENDRRLLRKTIFEIFRSGEKS